MAGQLLTVPQVAERLHLSRTTVYELLRAGTLPSFKIGKSRRVTEQALVDFVEDRIGSTASGAA